MKLFLAEGDTARKGARFEKTMTEPVTGFVLVISNGSWPAVWPLARTVSINWLVT